MISGLSPIEIALIMERNHAGQTISSIALDFGMNRNTITANLREARLHGYAAFSPKFFAQKLRTNCKGKTLRKSFAYYKELTGSEMKLDTFRQWLIRLNVDYLKQGYSRY